MTAPTEVYSPKTGDRVPGNFNITAHQGETFPNRLGHEHSIEGVFVIIGKLAHRQGVG